MTPAVSAPARKIRRRSLRRVAMLGSINANEVLPGRELCRRLNWGRKALTKARSDGLRAIRYGRGLVFLGSDVVKFFQSLADRPAADTSIKET